MINLWVVIVVSTIIVISLLNRKKKLTAVMLTTDCCLIPVMDSLGRIHSDNIDLFVKNGQTIFTHQSQCNINLTKTNTTGEPGERLVFSGIVDDITQHSGGRSIIDIKVIVDGAMRHIVTQNWISLER